MLGGGGVIHWGSMVSHPEILIPECEPFFSQETYNFQKEFIYFKLN
jgi:hypothetical protein